MSHNNPCIDGGGGGQRLVMPAVPFSWLSEALAGPVDAIIGSAQLAHYGIAHAMARIDRARRYRRTVRELSRLDSWTLQDIGVERGQIPQIARELVEQDTRL